MQWRGTLIETGALLVLCAAFLGLCRKDMQFVTANMSSSSATPSPSPAGAPGSGTDPQTQPLAVKAAQTPAKKGGFRDWLAGLIADYVVTNGLVGTGTVKPGTPDLSEQVQVGDLLIHAEMSVGELVAVLSEAKGDDEEVISSFEEDAEHPAGVAIRNFWITFFYVVPPVAALVIGVAIGANFAGKNWFTFQGAAILIMCVIFEAVPVLLMLATAKLISRVMSGVRRSLGSALLTGTFFVVIALGSAAAQWTLLEGKVNMSDLLAVVGAGIRTFALPLAEIAGAIALPILRRKSLDEHLATIKKKNDAKIAINTQRIKSKLDVISAAITTKSTLQKEEDYQKKQHLANRLIDLVTEKIIRDTERSLGEEKKSGSSYGYRRDEAR